MTTVYKSPCDRLILKSGYNRGYFFRVLDNRAKNVQLYEKVIFETHEKFGIIVNRTGLPVAGPLHYDGIRFIIEYFRMRGADIKELIRVK